MDILLGMARFVVMACLLVALFFVGGVLFLVVLGALLAMGLLTWLQSRGVVKPMAHWRVVQSDEVSPHEQTGTTVIEVEYEEVESEKKE